MKVKITKSTWLKAESGEVEVTETEAERLFILGAAEVIVDKAEKKKKK